MKQKYPMHEIFASCQSVAFQMQSSASVSRSLRTALPPLSTLRANARSAEDKLSLAACISCLAASNSSILMEGTTNFSAAAAISCADSFARSRLVRMAASSTWSVSTTVWADSIPANAARHPPPLRRPALRRRWQHSVRPISPADPARFRRA